VGRCLIALGDLHRYLSLQAACSEFMAARFYTMVSSVTTPSLNILLLIPFFEKSGVVDGARKQHALQPAGHFGFCIGTFSRCRSLLSQMVNKIFYQKMVLWRQISISLEK
jgi:hypothetical protein